MTGATTAHDHKIGNCKQRIDVTGSTLKHDACYMKDSHVRRRHLSLVKPASPLYLSDR